VPRGSDDPIQSHTIQIGNIKFHIVSLESQVVGNTQIAANLQITGGGGYTQGSEKQYKYVILVEFDGKVLPYDIWHSLQQRIVEATGISANYVKIDSKD
jgi:hypothetical protein